MGCTPFVIRDQGGAVTGTGMLCTRGRRPRRRCACGAVASLACDGPKPGRKSGTCDAPICRRCVSQCPFHGPDRDLCRACAATATTQHGGGRAVSAKPGDGAPQGARVRLQGGPGEAKSETGAPARDPSGPRLGGGGRAASPAGTLQQLDLFASVRAAERREVAARLDERAELERARRMRATEALAKSEASS